MGNLQAFDRIPEHELYIFPCAYACETIVTGTKIAGGRLRFLNFILAIPLPDDPKEDMVVPNDSPIPYTFQFSQVPALQKPGGTVKVVDSRTFKASKTIAAAVISYAERFSRELHISYMHCTEQDAYA